MWWQILTLAWHAGMFVGLGGGLVLLINTSLGSTTTSGDVVVSIPIPGAVRKIVAGAIFPIGIIMVVLNGTELFTGNVMYLWVAKLAGKITWANLLKNWVMTYFGNLAGSLAVAFFLFHETELFVQDASYLCDVADHKTMSGHWWQYFLKAVGCNYLVCMALWCASSADDITAKIVSMWWPIFGFVALVGRLLFVSPAAACIKFKQR